MDLDAWIVPPPPKPSDELNGKVKKNKKGKEKDTNGVKSKKKRKEGNGPLHEDVLTPTIVEETAEERAEREQVFPSPCAITTLLTCFLS